MTPAATAGLVVTQANGNSKQLAAWDVIGRKESRGLAFGGGALKVGGGRPSQHQLADVLALYFGLHPCFWSLGHVTLEQKPEVGQRGGGVQE